MKLSVALVALLPIVIAAPAPFSLSHAPNALDNLGGIKDGVPLDGAEIPDALNVGDVGLASTRDTSEILENDVNVDVLITRDGDDSTALEFRGKKLVGDINKSIDTQLNTRGPQGQLVNVDDTIKPVLDLANKVTVKPGGIFRGKRELSPAEILANARKALSAAEKNHEKYPNEITKAAYTNAVATVRALLEARN